MSKHSLLTPREKAIVCKIAAGHTNGEIAQCLCLSVKTVETYLTRIFRKVGVRSRVELALWEVRQQPAAPHCQEGGSNHLLSGTEVDANEPGDPK